MIIICHTEPGHSNQLFQNAFAWAYAKEKKRFFANCSDIKWWKYYKGGRPFLSILLNALTQYRYKIPLFIQRILKVGYINMDSYETMQEKTGQLSSFNIVFLSGWFLRVPLEKYRTILREKFVLRKKYYKKNQLVSKVTSLKDSGYTVVGIHIRRGDYKNYEDGKYFYDFELYLDKIQELRNILNRTKIQFILFSNENVPKEINGHDIIVSTEEWFIDHHLMSKCDYLLGPPSTFTIWSSFIGGAKLCLLQSPKQLITLKDFQEYTNPLCY